MVEGQKPLGEYAIIAYLAGTTEAANERISELVEQNEQADARIIELMGALGERSAELDLKLFQVRQLRDDIILAHQKEAEPHGRAREVQMELDARGTRIRELVGQLERMRSEARNIRVLCSRPGYMSKMMTERVTRALDHIAQVDEDEAGEGLRALFG